MAGVGVSIKLLNRGFRRRDGWRTSSGVENPIHGSSTGHLSPGIPCAGCIQSQASCHHGKLSVIDGPAHGLPIIVNRLFFQERK